MTVNVATCISTVLPADPVSVITAATQQVLKAADPNVATKKWVRRQVAAATQRPYKDPLLKSTVKAVIDAEFPGMAPVNRHPAASILVAGCL